MEKQYDWVHSAFVEYLQDTPKNKDKVDRVKKHLSPSEQAKKAGLKSFAEVMSLTSMSRSTLESWQRNRPKLFEVILAGCVVKKNELEQAKGNRE